MYQCKKFTIKLPDLVRQSRFSAIVAGHTAGHTLHLRQCSVTIKQRLRAAVLSTCDYGASGAAALLLHLAAPQRPGNVLPTPP